MRRMKKMKNSWKRTGINVCQWGIASIEVPATMTAAVAGLALIPLVLAADQPGKEILYPVAVVILGGLVSSTFLDMAVTPAVFFKFGRRAAEKYLERAKVDPLDAIDATPPTRAAAPESPAAAPALDSR